MTDPALIQRYHVARSFYESLMKSQWLPQERIIAWQERQLQQMLAHAHAQVPFYAEPLGRIRKPDGGFDLSRWEELPIISREVVEADWDAFQARTLPPGHEGLISQSTSASESQGFRVRKTRFDHTGVACASFRYADWFGHDYATPLVMIRAGFIRPERADDPEDKLWGPPWLPPETRGSRHRLHISTPLDEQLDWLMGLGQVILNTLPSNAMALAQRSEERGLRPGIKSIMSVGEKLSRDMREEVRRIWGCEFSDVYATAETGLIAIECPQTGLYHLQPELSRTEIVDDDGHPCPPGKAGLLVATSLYNFAMPLIRYKFQDLVEEGPPCTCSRGLPVLSRIIGRKSNLFERPDGSLYQPDVSTARIRDITGARAWQLTQHGAVSFTLALASPTALSTTEMPQLQSYLRTLVGDHAEINVIPVNDFPRSKGGKFYPLTRSKS